ncbi:MAG: UvrD-helicase domain-containing protein, partial [Acidobacteriaceae bacterium]|nr:UvrD-helicase domain-containing protein [Acidobacteriaceae bacterium]
QAVLENDARHGWDLPNDTSRLQIQTIDSLCAMLTRHMPVISRLGGSPRVIENPAELYHLAARQTISDLAEGSQTEKDLFRRVALHFDNDLNRLESQMARMLEKREQWRSFKKQAHESEDVQAFCDLLCHAEAALKDVFREAGEVDFTEITRAAIDALGTPEAPSDLLFWLDYRIEHLLVDEFQDTSVSQYALIKALTEQWSEGDNRTVFLVGDPMQSIYRFREAEVGFFLNCWKESRLGSVRLTGLRLVSNFRSTPEIVDWAQKTFAPIMNEDDPLHGGVKLRHAQATRPETGMEPRLIPFVDDKGEQEARQVAQLAKDALKHGDAAILVRSRNHLSAILPALRTADIRYEAIEIDQLRQEQHILDLISLTRAILHVGDRLSWLACLRAPWCGLTLADLSSLAEHEPGRTIFELLSTAEKIYGLSVDGRIRALRVQEILESAMSAIGRMPLRDLVERTWIALGGPSALREASHREDAQTYFDLLEEFEQGGIIRDFSLLNERLEFLFAKPVTGADCVKVMTIHGAKGLEFDTVIVPQLGRRAKPSERELLLWTEQVDEHGRATLLVAAQPQKAAEDQKYKYVCDEVKKKEQHELKRLFYVAVTRAKNRLYLLGNAGTKNNGTEVADVADGTMLKFIWPGVKPQFEKELSRKRREWHQASLFSEAESEPFNIVRRLPSAWEAPKLERSVRWQPELRRAVASTKKISFDWVSDTSRHIGTVVHDLLKRVAREGLASWTEARLSAIGPLVSSELLRLGVAASEGTFATQKVLRALSTTILSDRGRWILASHPVSHSEWAIGGRVGDKLISGTVDRAFRDADGPLWVIDYKTSEHEGADLEEFLNKEEERYRAQLDNYAALLARLTTGPISLGLYFPLLDAWREWRFAEETVAPATYTGV